MHAYGAEFLGTALLVLFGNGVVANVVLAETKGHGSGWIVISAGWGIAVFIGAFCSQAYSGAHLNPAVSLAMLLAGELEPRDTLGYVASQLAGGMLGAALVYLFYREHFRRTDDASGKMACFCTSPNVRNLPQAFLCEVIGTFVLILPIFLMADPSIQWGGLLAGDSTTEFPTLGLGTLGLLPVGLLVFGIGLSLGGTTGYAINPARDLGPRIVHFLLPIQGKRDSDWAYAWVPVLGPLTGAALATLTFRLLMAP
jgi:glycerol uptake facilitator protein